jgi:hypothetical protein
VLAHKIVVGKRISAWSYVRPDGTRRFFTVLHMPPVASPRDAVRTAIAAEQRVGK